MRRARRIIDHLARIRSKRWVVIHPGTRKAQRIGLLLLCGLAWTGAILPDEPQVHQGAQRDPAAAQHVFTTPMVMEMKLEAARPEKQRTFVTSKEFESYVCDSVHLLEIESYVYPKKDLMHVHLTATTYTEPGHDKMVTIEVELLSSGDVFATGTIGPFKSEEKKNGCKKGKITVPLGKWPTDAVPGVRLTMSVVNE
jgi:hypothetical protein